MTKGDKVFLPENQHPDLHGEGVVIDHSDGPCISIWTLSIKGAAVKMTQDLIDGTFLLSPKAYSNNPFIILGPNWDTEYHEDPKCECGAMHTNNKNCHSDWCAMYKESK